MTIRSLSRHLLGPALLACGMLLLTLAPAAGDATKDKEPRKQENHLVLKARALPVDPFSERNAAAAPAGEALEVGRGSTFYVSIDGNLLDGWYTYPLTRREAEQASKETELSVVGGDFRLLYPVQETESQWKSYNSTAVKPHPVHKKPFEWTAEVYVKPDAKPGKTTLTLEVKAQVCADSCTDEVHRLDVPVVISAEPAITADEAMKARLAAPPPQPTIVPIPAELLSGSRGGGGGGDGDDEAGGSSGLLGSIGTAIGGGLVSLLTPCVFPMIPITVSYFLKQAERRKLPAPALATGTGITTGTPPPLEDEPAPHSPLLLAAIYSGTIVLVLSAGGLALLAVLVKISTHPITNVILGALFLFFALSLLGWYDVTLPSWLQDLTSSREGKGGLVGVFFMALTFSIVSFACVGPIYGSFVSLQATSSGTLGLLERALPVIAYSMAFSSPFFVLALFPTLLRKMPRAGSWMNAVKVVMGFLELAAVVKFFRTAELLWTGKADFLSYDLSMGLYVAISVACGLYLLNVYRLPHDHDPPESIGVPRLLFSLGFIGLGLYLLPAVFEGAGGESQRPGGIVFAWVDSFLLPDPEPATKPAGKSVGGPAVVWEHDLGQALAKARSENKLVFLDFTGTSCTNCKLNERDVFPRPEVQQAFTKHVLLKLYTDRVPAGVKQEPNEAKSLALRDERFIDALPVYALLRPKGDDFEIVSIYGKKGSGLIKDVPGFVRWLDR